MTRKGWKRWVAWSGLLLLSSGMAPAARGAQTKARAASPEATGEKIVNFVRVQFGVPDAGKLTISPLQSSVFADSYDATLIVDDGKQKRPQKVLVSRDGRYLILMWGDIFDMTTAGLPEVGDDRVVPFIREHFKLAETVKLSLSPPRSSVFPMSHEATLTVGEGTKEQKWTVLISKDSRYLIMFAGDALDMNFDVKREAQRTISMTNQASQGPGNAPVTIVEYADLECPMCARVHEFFEKQLLPKYGNKVRLVFKENPLVAIHEWALAASLTSQCIYQVDPGAFVPFRSLVFQNQMSINAANAREMLLTYAEQVGVDRVKLAPCLDAKTSLPRVEESMAEAKRLKITSTPTCFINGKMVVGFPSPEAYFKAVDEALRGAK